MPVDRPIAEIAGIDPHSLPEELLRSGQPVVLRGLVGHWPMAQAGRASASEAVAYLQRFEREGAPPAVVTVGPPEIGGRFFYNHDLSDFNFRREHVPLGVVLKTLLKYADRGIAAGDLRRLPRPSTPGCRVSRRKRLRARRRANRWPASGSAIARAFPRIRTCLTTLPAWSPDIGAFTLFPPQQIVQPVHRAARFHARRARPSAWSTSTRRTTSASRRFAEALKAAQVAELGPGDAVFIPSMWWHYIRRSRTFNMLVNYWWRQSPAYMDRRSTRSCSR